MTRPRGPAGRRSGPSLPDGRRQRRSTTRLLALLALFWSGAALTAAPTVEAIPEAPVTPTIVDPPEPVPAPRTADAGANDVSALAAYLAAVDLHVASNPALAAAYTVFWSELKDSKRYGGAIADLAPEKMSAVLTTSQRVATAVDQHYRGVPATYAAGEALRIALLTLARDRSDGPTQATRAERLLANLDRSVAPLVTVDGRYEYAGNLQRPADLGFSAEVWLLCRQSASCMDAHDTLFAPAMAGAALDATLARRLEQDPRLTGTPQWPALLAAATDLEARLAATDTPASARNVAGFAAREYWRSITAGIPLAAGAPLATGITPPPAGASPVAGDVHALEALFTLGRAGAHLAGQDALANVFTVTRSPVLDFAAVVSQGALLGTLASSTAGVGLLFAGVQALSLFDNMAADSRSTAAAPAELRRLVLDLNEATYRGMQSARAEQLLATNTIDTRVAALGIALDVVKTDVARLESAARRRVGSDFQTAAAKRWTAFDEDNERCFSLRNRDPKTGLLRAAEFRRCEDRFLQGATRRSQYATRATEYVLDARFMAPGDPRFPFHDHYPLLATLGGLDSRSALALPDPLEWQQHAAALLRLYQENPAGAGEQQKRREVLAALGAAGGRTQQALLGLTLREAPDGTLGFREDIHRKALDDYFGALRQLAVRVSALDDPDAHPYGKRLTEGLDQPLPDGLKRAAMEATLSGAATGSGHIRTCSNAPASAFLPQAERLLAESRRFFGSPVRPEELAAAWNRQVVDDLSLQPASFVDLVPPHFLWASLEGLGTIEICLSRFRPETVAFTRDKGPGRDALLGTTLVGAEVQVRFRASAATAAEAGMEADRIVVIGDYAAERACTFGYRNDEEQCNRAECLPQLAPLLWSGDSRAAPEGARCEGETLSGMLPRRNLAAPDDSARRLSSAIETVYWQQQAEKLARLEADVLRSSEYELASALYLKYYALAGITLGTYPDSGAALGGLFSPTDPLAPRGLVQSLISDRLEPAELLGQLASREQRVRAAVAERGREVEQAGPAPDFPHLRALAETLARIDLATSAYAGR